MEKFALVQMGMQKKYIFCHLSFATIHLLSLTSRIIVSGPKALQVLKANKQMVLMYALRVPYTLQKDRRQLTCSIGNLLTSSVEA